MYAPLRTLDPLYQDVGDLETGRRYQGIARRKDCPYRLVTHKSPINFPLDVLLFLMVWRSTHQGARGR